jgi:putative ABC transport system ATP-binding protein
MLEIRDLSKRYASPAGRGAKPVAALDNVSLSLGAGEFVAVQGPSGSGKTTLLLAAGGLLRPSSGTVAFQGQDLYAMPPPARARWRAECIGFVFQQFHLVPYLNVYDNILAPTLALACKDARQRAEELIERFRLVHRRLHVPASLSTGEQQRVALARALLHRPRLLLCDEPTGNLDDENGATVIDCLAEFQRDGGAVLLVTHRREATVRASRRVCLQEGRLAATSPSPSMV